MRGKIVAIVVGLACLTGCPGFRPDAPFRIKSGPVDEPIIISSSAPQKGNDLKKADDRPPEVAVYTAKAAEDQPRRPILLGSGNLAMFFRERRPANWVCDATGTCTDLGAQEWRIEVQYRNGLGLGLMTLRPLKPNDRVILVADSNYRHDPNNDYIQVSGARLTTMTLYVTNAQPRVLRAPACFGYNASQPTETCAYR